MLFLGRNWSNPKKPACLVNDLHALSHAKSEQENPSCNDRKHKLTNYANPAIKENKEKITDGSKSDVPLKISHFCTN